MTHHLVGVAEIAEMLGVSRQRADQIIRNDGDFPSPEVVITAGRVWSREAIEQWAGEAQRDRWRAFHETRFRLRSGLVWVPRLRVEQDGDLGWVEMTPATLKTGPAEGFFFVPEDRWDERITSDGRLH